MRCSKTNIDSTASLWLVIVGALLPYLLPRSETVEKYLASYLEYSWLIWVAKSSTGVLLLALTYYFYQKTVAHISPEKQEKLIALIKDKCNAEYRLRHNELSARIQHILTDYSSRGFDILPGSAFAQIADLYLKELCAYSDILLITISDILYMDRFKLKTEVLTLLTQEMVLHKSDEFNSYYCSFIDHHSQFIQGPPSSVMDFTKTSFKTQINLEARLNLSKISSQIELKNIE